MMNRSEGNRDGEERVNESNKREEQRIRKMEAKAVQNVNLYFIFQAVILASTSSTTCRNSWIPIALSLVAAVTNFIGFFADISKILRSRQQLDQNLSDLAFIKLHQLTPDQLDQVPPGASLYHQGQQIIRPDGASFNKWKRRFAAYFSVALFAGFTAILTYGCHRIRRIIGSVSNSVS